MKTRSIIATVTVALVVVAGAVSSSGCRKQPKCGCDGDALDTLLNAHVYITYNADSKSAQFTPIWDPYSVYYFCNPSEFMGELTKFDQGEEILVSGPYFYECNYLMNSSNSYYYNPYRVYQIQVTGVASYDYGK